MNTRIRILIVSVAACVGISLAPAVAGASAPAKRPKPAPSLAVGCFYGGYTGPQCAGLPTPANDFEGRNTPPRWDPCPADSTRTLLYLLPCGPMSPTVAQWCRLHFDHHSYFGDEARPCR